MRRPARYGLARGQAHAVARILLLALALTLSSAARHASAQASEPAPPPQYHALIESALEESAASRWPEALALFRQAHALYPNARTHRGIGMVAYELRDYVEAARNLSLALRSERRPLDAAQRAEVTQLLEHARGFLGRYELAALPPDTALTVDGKRVEREPDGTLLLALGSHTLEAHASAPERTGSAQLQVNGGEHEPLPVVLRAVAPLAPAAASVSAPGAAPSSSSAATPATASAPTPVATPTPTPTPTSAPAAATAPRESDAHERSNTLPIVLTATGGALLVAGAVLLVVGLGDVATVEDAKQDTPWPELKAANDRAPILTGVGIGLLSAGGVLALGGGVLWLSGDEEAAADDAELDGLSLRMRACF